MRDAQAWNILLRTEVALFHGMAMQTVLVQHNTGWELMNIAAAEELLVSHSHER